MDLLRFRPVRSSGVLAALAVVLCAAPAAAFRWPWEGNPWPTSSAHPVTELDHRTVESAFSGRSASEPYRFAAFGDQRALADGEWQEMIGCIAAMDGADTVSFLVDTGDIVDDGSHADQFSMLRDILRPVHPLPYLVGVGNHELDDNEDPRAREHTARFLAYLDDDLSPDRLYYRKDVGAATFLFLDTNDFTYGEDGGRDACPVAIGPDTREGRQLAWLRRQAAELGTRDRLVVAVMHHPLVQSSEKHYAAACALWNFSDGGEGLADLLADAGVDVILTGHTHTYERFRMVRRDGCTMQLVNLSGRPRDAFLWIGSDDRRARDIRGEEHAWLEELGWVGLDHWEIAQEDWMRQEDEADQFAVFTVEPDGGLTMQIRFLDEDAPDGTRASETVRLP